jgi:hypothetical protein
MPDGAVVSLDVSVLLGLPRLNVQDGNPLFLSPFHQHFTDVFRAVVDPYCAGFAAPFNVEEGQETVWETVSPTTGQGFG